MLVALSRLLVLALACSVGACGGPAGAPTPSNATSTPLPVGSSQTPPTAIAIDSCALLSDKEIQAATGQTVSKRTPSTLTRVFPSVCDLELDGGGALTVSIMPSGGRSIYETSFEPFIGDENFLIDRAVEGLGDKAGISGDEDLLVLKGDVLFDLFLPTAIRSDTETVLRYLAEIILAKLPCLAAGCPGFTPPPPPSFASALDVCSLLTDEEIQTATGFKSLESQQFPGVPGDVVCAWALDTEPIPSTINLTIRENGGREEFDFWANAFDTPPEHLAGLGDDAFKTGTVPDGIVYAVVGDRLIKLRFSMPLSVDDPYALVIPLVQTALSRMP